MKAKKTMLIFMIFTILIIGINTLKGNNKIVNIIQPNIVEDTISIVDRENYTSIIPGIIDISNVSWSDNNTIQFKGMKVGSKKYNYFSFNIEKKELMIINEKSMLLKDGNTKGKNDVFSIEIDDNSFLSYKIGDKNHGLFYIKNDNKPIKLANSIEYIDDFILKLSENHNRLAFYDVELEKIRVYSLENNVITDIDFEVSEYVLKNFNDALQFSGDTGYFFIETINNDDINDSNYSVFGSDSGKLYGDKLLGLNPVWANNNLSIAFIYSEKNIDVFRDTSNNIHIAGSRLGVYNLKNRKIKYTEVITNPNKIINKPLWSSNDDEIFILLGNKDDNNYYVPTKIYTYSNIKNTLTDLNYSLNVDNFIFTGNKIDLREENKKLMIISKSSIDNNGIISIDLQGRSMDVLENLQYFQINNRNISKKVLYRYLDDNEYIYISDNCVYKYHNESSFLKYKSLDTIINVYESPDKDKALIITNLEDDTELSIIKL